MGRLGDIADIATLGLLGLGGFLIYRAITGFKLELPQLELPQLPGLGPELLPYIEHPPWDVELETQVTELGTGISDLEAALAAQAEAIRAQQARIDEARAGLPILADPSELGITWIRSRDEPLDIEPPKTVWRPEPIVDVMALAASLSKPEPVSTWVQEPLVDIMALAKSLTPMGGPYEVL